MVKNQPEFFEMSRDEPTAISMGQQSQLVSTHKKYGKHFVFWFKNGEPQIVIGPHWYLSVLVVGMIIFFGQVMHNITLQVKNVGWVHQWISQGIIILDLVFFLVTALKNEGIVTPENQCSPEDADKF
ncbi:hypothetical protein PPERSA_07054 [Pseudocohnilembus persalinus]|uniref:Uncharacterized protein n=1 Tax=Pseudocohnilembus persalinus TaxID=266149 RepID=A0A0V0QAR1_PSEPJ|nr:hypothetical protein PPERSA_07054 [Pseudocohnilembus persalinus]|eukprot:KRW99282.1 hypothetical protein PPERSA_07054 [Pseudocohnilembus persalinus]